MSGEPKVEPSAPELTTRAATAAPSWVIGRSPQMHRIVQHLGRVAEVECPALISGETGTGKEIVAGMIHSSGPRQSGAFIPVNCAALTPTLAESQLFGHERGAFTGAVGSSLGVFRAAEGGVVFLDEVGEMPKELQPKLLRVLQQSEVTPVGSSTPVSINVQVLAATNRDLEVEVAEGRFRKDLLYRLNMVDLRLPPLRERVEDLPELIGYFSQRFSVQYDRPAWIPPAAVLQQFCEYAWPGNIRELQHVIEQGYVLDCEPHLPEDADRRASAETLPYVNLSMLRESAVRQALRMSQGHKGRAARLLGVHANTLTRMLAELFRSDSADDVDGTNRKQSERN